MTEAQDRFDVQPDLFTTPIDGPGQARRSDPDTSQEAAKLIRAKATTARVLLLEAHARHQWTDVVGPGLTDEQAASAAGLAPTSEYATRCSELMRMGALENTGKTRPGRAGAMRQVRRITAFGRWILDQRSHNQGP